MLEQMDGIRNILEKVLSDLSSIILMDLKKVGSSKTNVGYIATIDINGISKELMILWGSSAEPGVLKKMIFEIENSSLQNDRYTVYVAPYVSDISSDLLKQRGIGSIDLSGNAFLSFDNVLIDRKGNENRFRKRRSLKSLFSRRSTRIIRKLLIDPDRKWKTIELAEESGVSTGFVSMVLKNLSREGFIEREWGSIRISKPGDLLDIWAENYKFDMSPAVGYFCPLKEREQIFQRLRDIDDEKYALTMGAAASIIAPHVRSTDTYLYSMDDDILIERLDLEPVEFGGNIYLMRPYDVGILFDRQIVGGISLVSNIQLYLDLFNYPARGREQAEFLRENVMEY